MTTGNNEQVSVESPSVGSSQAAQHTPAPWKASGNAVHYKSRCVALVYDPNSSERVNEVVKANGRLIAAAPELLEALLEVLATGLNGGNNYRLVMIAASQSVLDSETLQRAEASEQAMQKAWAAIEKARGLEA